MKKPQINHKIKILERSKEKLSNNALKEKKEVRERMEYKKK